MLILLRGLRRARCNRHITARTQCGWPASWNPHCPTNPRRMRVPLSLVVLWGLSTTTAFNPPAPMVPLRHPNSRAPLRGCLGLYSAAGGGGADRRSALAAAALCVLGRSPAAGAVEAAEFYARWPYAQPADILPYIYANSEAGDPESVLRAMDAFGMYYPMYKLGEEKGRILEREIAAMPSQPKTAVELGSFLGYSALRTARSLAQGGRMYCIEYNPMHAEVAQQVLQHAGLADRVTFVVGISTEKLPSVAPMSGRADLVFLDHAKDVYLGDLLLMEKLGIVGKGTLVVADNVLYPGAPGYLEHVQRGKYETRLVKAKFEYDQKWKRGWTSKEDALSFSLKIS